MQPSASAPNRGEARVVVRLAGCDTGKERVPCPSHPSRLGGNGAAPLAVGGFASSHTGGVNFAMGDGSVRFIAEDASAGLLGRLANRADGKISTQKNGRAGIPYHR